LQIIVLSLAALYVGDYLSVRYRIPKSRDPLGSVDIKVYYAVGLKGNKVEYMPGDPETQTCVHSLFPHLGYQPCWYVSRHRQKWIEIGRRADLPYTASMADDLQHAAWRHIANASLRLLDCGACSAIAPECKSIFPERARRLPALRSRGSGARSSGR